MRLHPKTPWISIWFIVCPKQAFFVTFKPVFPDNTWKLQLISEGILKCFCLISRADRPCTAIQKWSFPPDSWLKNKKTVEWNIYEPWKFVGNKLFFLVIILFIYQWGSVENYEGVKHYWWMGFWLSSVQSFHSTGGLTSQQSVWNPVDCFFAFATRVLPLLASFFIYLFLTYSYCFTLFSSSFAHSNLWLFKI